MWCPKCCGKTKVVGTTTGLQNERFRKCVKCNYTFQTLEAIKFDDYWKEYARETHKKDTESQNKEEYNSSHG